MADEVGNFDPDYKNQQNTTTPPNNRENCLTANQLDKKLNVDETNEKLGNVMKTAGTFIDNYIKGQDKDDKDKRDEMNENRLRQTVNLKRRELIDQHKIKLGIVNKELKIYKSELQSYKNAIDLENILQKNNNQISKTFKNKLNTIEISDRKTYYENNENSYAMWWAGFFKKYYWFIILFLISGIVITKKYNDKMLWIKAAAVTIYPFLAYLLFYLVYLMIRWIKDNTKWIYLYDRL